MSCDLSINKSVENYLSFIKVYRYWFTVKFLKAAITLKLNLCSSPQPTLQLHSKYDHDCSKCDPPPGFPTGPIPPRELDPSEGPIDGQKMWTFFSNKFTSQITRIVNFSKMIPGFKQLDREDQITLIKTGLFEVRSHAQMLKYLSLSERDRIRFYTSKHFNPLPTGIGWRLY